MLPPVPLMKAPLLLVALLATTWSAHAGDPKPNIVLIVADDLAMRMCCSIHGIQGSHHAES